MADSITIENKENELTFELDNLVISGTVPLDDYYTKEQTDSMFNNYYDKEEVDDIISQIEITAGNYTGGNGINVSDDNIISIDDTVALKTDIPNTDNFVTTNTSQTITGLKTFNSLSTRYNNAGIDLGINGANIEFVGSIGRPKFYATGGTSGIYYESGDISYNLNNVALKTDIPNTDDFVTETDLSGRVIPEGSYSNFDSYSRLTVGSTADSYTRIGGDIYGNIFRNVKNVFYGGNYKQGEIGGIIYSDTEGSSANSYGIGYVSDTGIRYNFNHITAQLKGDTIESNLTKTYALNIGKAYLCNETSTSGTYQQGHIYLIGGTSGAYTATDITPTSIPTTQTILIESTSWSTLSDSSPYTYQAQVTLTTTLSENSVVELINNQPILFATYGFAIASISGQVVTLYSIGQPSEDVTLTLGVTK